MRKVRVTRYLKPETFRALQTTAQAHGLSVGRFAAHKLEHAIEVSTVRWLLYHELLHSGMDRTQARSLHDQLWYQSVQRLKQPRAEIEEILAALPPQKAQSLASVLNAAPAERRDGTSA